MNLIKGKPVFQPLIVALNGLVYTFRTQRHMRFHLWVVVIVTLLGIQFKLKIRDLLILLFTIDLVLIAEMFNSAIEATVDLVEPKYNPLAKFAKDIAAGAVLITATMAIVVGGLLMLGDIRFEEVRTHLTYTPPDAIPTTARLIFGVLLVFVFVVIGKGLGKQGQVFRGGLVSGHSALGFFLAIAVLYISNEPLVGAIGLVLAGIIAESRWEARIHSAVEIALGAGVGAVIAVVVFGIFGVPRI